MHRRLRPIMHRFRYNAFWMLFDLDEIAILGSRLRLFSHNRFNLFSLHEADHGDGSQTPLRSLAEHYLSQAGIDIAGGPVRLFCMPRTLGYSFNPLSVFFCHRPGGQLAAIIYQVHNTFGERHAYVAPLETSSDTIRHDCDKTFFVSPFMDMNITYHFRLSEPAERFALCIGASRHGESTLSACLTASRHPLSDLTLIRTFFLIPLVTVKVTLAIHWEALRLWLKRLPLRSRPRPPAHAVTLAARQRINSHAP